MPAPGHPAHTPLAPGAVHLWWVPGGAAQPRQRRARLDGLLRRILAGYTGTPAAQLQFGREPRGRPYLLPATAAAQPRTAAASPPPALPDFNLSDTVGGTLVGVACGVRIGVDLERTARTLSHRALAPRYFAPEEAEALAALPEARARQTFLRLWTAKEAACKATGSGIGGMLAQWVFACNRGDPRLLRAPVEAQPAAQWQFRRLAPAPGYTAVLACRGVLGAVELLRMDRAR